MYQSLKQNHEKPDFSHVGKNSWKLKSQLKKNCVGIVKNGRGLLDHGTQKSALSLEWTSLFFLPTDTNSVKLKIVLTIYEWAWSKINMVF